MTDFQLSVAVIYVFIKLIYFSGFFFFQNIFVGHAYVHVHVFIISVKNSHEFFTGVINTLDFFTSQKLDICEKLVHI